MKHQREGTQVYWNLTITQYAIKLQSRINEPQKVSEKSLIEKILN